MRVYSLSIHAGYACGRSGACCTSGWPIPVERPTYERLRERIRARTLTLPTEPERGPFLHVAGAPDETPVVAAVQGDDRACVFYERESGLCAIHRQAGASLLPVACRQFPRVSLRDRRGLFVNLSHYCPTAARLLFQPAAALRIVEAPPAFPPTFDYDPLDARDALPPLLRPGVLLDLDTFDRWERHVVATLGTGDGPAEDAVEKATAFTEALRTWRRERGELAAHFDEAVEVGAMAVCPRSGFDESLVRRHYSLVAGAVPAGLRHALADDSLAALWDRWVDGAWLRFAAPVRRYLATKVFASWLAYQGEGVRTIAFAMTVALSVLKANAALSCRAAGRRIDEELMVAAVRRTDELLVHLAGRQELADALGAVEKVEAGLSSDVR